MGSSYVVIDAKTGRTLIGASEHIQLPIASLTKIWTALVVLENSDLKDEVTISRQAATVEGSSIYLEEGASYSIDYLLHGLMMQSGNDAATALAEHVGGSVEGFVYLMNEKADFYGLKQTYFTNPTGLHHEKHMSSAYDTAKMLQIAMQNADFKKIASTKQYSSKSNWKNKHRLLHGNSGAVAGKTGYTKAAGRTLATFFEREQKQFIVVTLNEGNDWQVHQNLADQIDQDFDLVTVIDKGHYEQNKLKIIVTEPLEALIEKREPLHFRHIVYLSRLPNSKRAVWHVYVNNELLFTKLVTRK